MAATIITTVVAAAVISMSGSLSFTTTGILFVNDCKFDTQAECYINSGTSRRIVINLLWWLQVAPGVAAFSLWFLKWPMGSVSHISFGLYSQDYYY